MAKTFYKLTPKAKKIANKLDKVRALFEQDGDAIEELDINTVNIQSELEKSDVLFLFQQFDKMEFCDMDNFGDRKINFYLLEQQGFIKETYVDEF